MTKKQVVTEIKKTYEKKLAFLRPYYQYHYAQRLWRIDNDQKYLQPIFADFQIRTLKYIPTIARLDNHAFVKEESLKLLKGYPGKTEKKALRRKVYEKYPEVLFYSHLLQYLFLAKAYYLNTYPGFRDYYNKALGALKRVDLKKFYLSPEMIEYNPSASANYSYYQKYLGVADYEKELLTTFKDFWLNKETPTKLEFLNKVYGLTHLVIASSYFYQEIVNYHKLEWIFDFFDENFDLIIERSNPDVVAEVGLCFKLAGKFDHKVVKKAQKYVISKFDPEKGFIPRDNKEASIEKLEHRNTIALLLLSDFDDLNLGPNLAIYLRERKRALYLPEKGRFIGRAGEEEI
jgi:hypothetical protein